MDANSYHESAERWWTARCVCYCAGAGAAGSRWAEVSPTAYVTLSRLEGNTHNMWVAIAVKDDVNTLTNITARSLVASPVIFQGKGGAFEGTIGQAYILDHLYNPIGQALVTGTPALANNASYSTAVSYVSSFKAGAQEGVVQVLFTTPVEANPSTTVMVKVLLDPKSVVVQGPVSCPIATQVQGYWPHVLGLDTSTSSVGTVSCANLKGDPSLQALVPVYTNGKLNGVYVYDNLTTFDLATGPHPVQIYKLQTQGASMSGASTIMTMNGDLYREFGWSATAGTFVQVVFPGMFPIRHAGKLNISECCHGGTEYLETRSGADYATLVPARWYGQTGQRRWP